MTEKKQQYSGMGAYQKRAAEELLKKIDEGYEVKITIIDPKGDYQSKR